MKAAELYELLGSESSPDNEVVVSVYDDCECCNRDVEVESVEISDNKITIRIKGDGWSD